MQTTEKTKLIEWDETFSVNVAKIDGQHEHLVDLINELHSHMSRGQGKAVIGKTLDELIDYAASHFTTEETYFDLYRYPGTISHKKEHAMLVDKVVAFRSDFTNGKTSVSIEVLTFLRDWLRDHIKGSDKKYGPFFNSKGLK